MDAIKNPYFIIPILSLLLAQIAKFAMPAIKRDFDWLSLLVLEGKPATAIVVAASLVSVAWTVSGLNTSAFGIAVALLLIVMWQHTTMHRRSIDLSSDIAKIHGESLDRAEKREKLHINTWLSAGLGLLSGLVFTVSYWTGDEAWIGRRPSDDESQNYLYFFVAVLVISEIIMFLTTRRKSTRKLPTSRRIRRAIRLSLTLPAVFGLVFALLQNQTSNSSLTERYWTTIFLLWIPIATIWAYLTVYAKAKLHLAEEAEHFVKATKKNKKKKSKSKKKSRRRR